MIISHKYKFIFLKTVKVAGTSVECALLPYLGPDDVFTGLFTEGIPPRNCVIPYQQHANCHEIAKTYPKEWANYYKFTIERNPWDTAVSAFYFAQSFDYVTSKYRDVPRKTTKSRFRRWVRSVARPGFINWYFYTDNDWITVDRVLMYENLNQEFSELCAELGISYQNELDHVKVKSGIRNNTDYREMYDDDTKEYIAKYHQQTIKHFGYKF